MLREIKNSKRHYFVDEKNLIQGEYKCWWDNTKLFEHCFYLDGKLHGEYNGYWDNGQIYIRGLYVNGKKHGEYKSWWTDNSIRAHRFYINGKSTLFKELLYPETNEDRLYFTLKYGIPLLPLAALC